MTVLVVGSVAFDTVTTPFGHKEKILGGSATYFAYSCSFFAPVNLVAVVGEDFPPSYRELLEKREINLEGLQVRPGETFHWGGSYKYDMNEAETEFTDLNVFEDFHPDLPPSYRSSEYILLANIDPHLQLEVLEQIENPRLVVGDTMNLWIELKKETVQEVIRKLQILIINDAEARQLTGEVSLKKAAARILKLGPEYVVVKKGEHGALFFSRRETFSAPGLPLETVVDPTGAGDTFAGGFVGYLAKMGEISPSALRQAVIYGSVMASFNVEDFSLDRLKNLQWDDIIRRYQEFKSLTLF
ncbi:MAG: PfkB family carbohydrate kinase [Candidatus Euphemobacter frigidus]|nr:PfkB family carbohydrate kinase [Candidatus Euphemobacter frigidus]MDP8274931.1 PfkB family carbohydrate kinase [Candidatus Euphemobacter frigidus]